MMMGFGSMEIMANRDVLTSFNNSLKQLGNLGFPNNNVNSKPWLIQIVVLTLLNIEQ